MRAMELVVLAVVVLASATWVTVHVALSWALSSRGPRWRGLAALVVPPLAPYWGREAELTSLTRAWLASLLTYGVALVVAAF